jgi:hypothetical protein
MDWLLQRQDKIQEKLADRHLPMRQAWAPLLFADEDQDAKLTRDPMTPAKRSEVCLDKVARRRLEDGYSGPQLLHPAGRARHHHQKHLPHAHGHSTRRGAHLPGHQQPIAPTTASLRSDRNHRQVVRTDTSNFQ